MTTEEHPIYRNAINAIQIAVEDFNEGTPQRIASAVRSLTSGILLLCKEKLRRISPEDEILIWKNVKPSKGKDGSVQFEKIGKATVDVQEIMERFKSFGVRYDAKTLKGVADVRNAVEHHYVEDVAQIRGAFVDGLRFLSQFMPENLGVNPKDALGEPVWDALIRQREIEDALKEQCQTTYASMSWPPLLKEIIEKVGCPECGSPLVKQVDSSNKDAPSAIWECTACGHKEDAQEWVGKVVPEHYGAEIHLAIKDGDTSPVDVCPECGEEAFVHEVSQCLACGLEVGSAGKCSVCGETLELEDYGESLCSYHRHAMEKD